MSEGRRRRIKDVTIGPYAIVGWVTAGKRRHARWHAQWRRTITRIEDDAFSGKSIQMWCCNDRITATTHDKWTVLIRVYVDEICAGHDVGNLSTTTGAGKIQVRAEVRVQWLAILTDLCKHR
jgi:hypothetical protein